MINPSSLPATTPATLSVVIAARNVASRIEGCVRPWLFAHEVIVVDQMSDDGTDRIAEALGCKVIRNEPAGGNFDMNRKLGMQKATGAWVLYIDTDERPSPELVKEIRGFIVAPPEDVEGARIPNHFYFLGKRLRHGIYNPRSAEIRLFRQGKWEYPCEGGYHRSVSVSGRVVTFKNAYKHFNVNTLSEWFLKTNQYTELDASPSRAKSWGAVLDFAKFFLRHFIWKRGFLDGYHGFLSVVYFGLYHFTLSAKSWEKAYLERQKLENDYLTPIPLPKR